MSEYTDIKQHTYTVLQTVLVTKEEKKEREKEILEALYRIFLKK